jgi:hypothetical protein
MAYDCTCAFWRLPLAASPSLSVASQLMVEPTSLTSGVMRSVNARLQCAAFCWLKQHTVTMCMQSCMGYIELAQASAGHLAWDSSAVASTGLLHDVFAGLAVVHNVR